ncbi:hypothetical protein ID866_5191 [Astraeus odoratus]|nr:hypothetical protein ID866_5191 [Astraeus odoratus]
MPVQTRSGGPTPTAALQRKRLAVPRKGKKKQSATEAEVPRLDKEHGDKEEQVQEQEAGKKRVVEHVETKDEAKESGETPAKKAKTDEDEEREYSFHEGKDPFTWSPPAVLTVDQGVIERGHVYFFYRPKVQHEQVHDIDDVKNFHILLVPRPPEFSVYTEGQTQTQQDEMTLISEGEDVAPAPQPKDQPRKHFRLITVGKKRLPDPDAPHGRELFWASVTAVGDDLHSLEQGLGDRTYQTKTRGERHEGPVRLAARGVYAVVNSRGKTPSRSETHLGYHLSHPLEAGEVQRELGIHTASSFVLQVKNPEVEPTSSFGQRVGLSSGRRAKYPEGIMKYVFGKGTRGISTGLRFSPCNYSGLLDYQGTELLLIAARTGVEGSDESLGESRGDVLKEVGERESQALSEDIFRELAIEKDTFPVEPMEGRWI